MTLHLEPESLWAIDSSKSDLYGIRTMQVLASNNPSCLFTGFSHFSTPKSISTVNNLEFEILFPQQIQGPVVASFLSLHPERAFSLHVLRMGFESGIHNPIVIHLLVDWEALSQDDACIMVSEIQSAVVSAQWKGEAIYVDICQTRSNPQAEREGKMRAAGDCEENLFDYRYFYHHIPPLPGSSLGPSDNPSIAGTLLGYIRHGNGVFALTNKHVVNSHGLTVLDPSKPYAYKEGEKKFFVTSPARKDHDETLKMLQASLNLLQDLKLNARSEKSREAAEKSFQIWEPEMHRASTYKIGFGYVYAASGQNVKEGTLDMDWAIIRCSFDHIAQNKYRNMEEEKNELGFLMSRKIKDHLEDWIKDGYYDKARKYFFESPEFKPARSKPLQREEVYMKPPSRSTDFKVAICNGIKAVVKEEAGIPTQEWCFVTHSLQDHVSTKGDSGSVLVDSEFRPAAMMWGGSSREIQDVTYATPLWDVFRDIETCMGWDVGSVVLC